MECNARGSIQAEYLRRPRVVRRPVLSLDLPSDSGEQDLCSREAQIMIYKISNE